MDQTETALSGAQASPEPRQGGRSIADLISLPGIAPAMLIALGDHGILSIEDLAACATDDLDGWTETKDGATVRNPGILESFRVSRQDCESLILRARVKAGWIK